MKYPNKYRVVVKMTEDDKDKVIDIIEDNLYENMNSNEIVDSLQNDVFTSKPYYFDIAVSKRFKLYQAMQKANVFNTRVTVKEEGK